MSSRMYESYDAALDEVERLVERVVKDKETLVELKNIISDGRDRKTVPIRGIQDRLMKYRGQFGDYERFTETERNMIQDIMKIWS